MLKPKKYDIAESNIALLGSDLEKQVKHAAAEKEPAWENAGKRVGVEIWRIEKFHVKPWPKEKYGEFYDGDSYIVLKTWKKPDADELLYDVFFWLGEYTTQDEAGTAAYKTVELDDKLGGKPVQHREVQDHESELFVHCFPKHLHILSGGVDSGFNHVEPEKFQGRLLQIKGRRKVRVKQVDRTYQSLNSGDVFILDLGLNIYQFNGRKSAGGEKMKGAQIARAMDDERKGLATVTVIDEGGSDMKTFWTALGSEGPIPEEAGRDDEAEEKMGHKRLFRLHEDKAGGELKFVEVADGVVKKNMLDSSDVFIFDIGPEVFAWIGHGASVAEKAKSLIYAEKYLRMFNRPPHLPIARILEGGENELFETSFD